MQDISNANSPRKKLEGLVKCRTRDQDFLEHMFVATNHQYMMFFTQKGKCFWMRVYEIQKEVKLPKEESIQNLVNIESEVKHLFVQDLKRRVYH
jgi:DNA gyrase subunit A